MATGGGDVAKSSDTMVTLIAWVIGIILALKFVPELFSMLGGVLGGSGSSGSGSGGAMMSGGGGSGSSYYAFPNYAGAYPQTNSLASYGGNLLNGAFSAFGLGSGSSGGGMSFTSQSAGGDLGSVDNSDQGDQYIATQSAPTFNDYPSFSPSDYSDSGDDGGAFFPTDGSGDTTTGEASGY
jgi:hypothetical protein